MFKKIWKKSHVNKINKQLEMSYSWKLQGSENHIFKLIDMVMVYSKKQISHGNYPDWIIVLS